MNLPDALLAHARPVAGSIHEPDVMEDINLRRAASAAYYAIFHRINGDAVWLLAPNISEEINHRIQRWFSHSERKTVCGRFPGAKLSGPLHDLTGESASDDMQTLARNFILLQAARLSADYDLSYELNREDTLQLLTLANKAFEAWQRLQGTAEPNVFILSLLLWKNWERER